MNRKTNERTGVGRARGDSERFAYATIEALSEHIAVLDEAGTIVAVNRAWREFAGANSLSPAGLGEGANYFAACERATGEGAADAARFAAGLRAVIGGEADEFSLEYPCHSPTQRRWFIARVTRFEIEGQIRAVVAHVNITTRKQAEHRLSQNEEQLRSIFEASRDGIFVEHDERIVYVNTSYARLFGYEKPEELVGKRVSVVLPPADAERMLEYGRRRMRGEPAPTAYEFRGKRRDGALIDLEASVSTHKAAGKTYITTTVRDIAERKAAEEALRQSESKYRLLLEQASDGIHTYDLRGYFIETNTKLCEMLGYTREELLGLNVEDLVPAEDLAADPIRFDQLRAGQTILKERRLRRKDGTLLPVEISGRMIRDGVLQSIIRDISERRRAEEEVRRAYDELERRVEERTRELALANETLKAEVAERRRAEETLRESEQRLRMALDTGKLGAWQLDLATLELDCSARCKANFGLPETALVSHQAILAAIHPEDRARVREAVRRAVAERGDYHAEYRIFWPDGSAHWILARGRALYDAEGTPLRMVGVTVNITERRQAEEVRKELLMRLVNAQEEERRRISRELHDQLGQRMTALTMGLKTLSADSHGRRSTLAGLLKLQELADELSSELHALAWGLRPPALDDLGLSAALYNYAEEWAERARVAVDFHSAGIDGRRLPHDIEITLYRVAQEALTNVLKHSGADRVSVVLERVGEHVIAVIEDNGKGFDPETLLKPSIKGRKLGLLGMSERAAMLGGTLSVESTPGAGASVFVRIPLKTGGRQGAECE
ncbi:MAG TPA: PAS domain S-box protein [Pyrinomonadaceae bacterium]|nr:PAS domain S-box protein [Pyrinomonadaceae bacterium]